MWLIGVGFWFVAYFIYFLVGPVVRARDIFACCFDPHVGFDAAGGDGVDRDAFVAEIFCSSLDQYGR